MSTCEHYGYEAVTARMRSREAGVEPLCPFCENFQLRIRLAEAEALLKECLPLIEARNHDLRRRTPNYSPRPDEANLRAFLEGSPHRICGCLKSQPSPYVADLCCQCQGAIIPTLHTFEHLRSYSKDRSA